MSQHGTHFNAIDGFLNHKGSSGGSGQYMKGWKEDGKLFAWLHCAQLPIGLWRHNFPQLIIREDKTTRKVIRNIWGQSDNCWEPENVLIKQNFRDKVTKQRDEMPKRCPMCRLIELIWQRVNVKQDLDFTTPILRFDGADNPKENTIIHAAGIYNGFSQMAVNKFSDAQKEAVAKAQIFLSEAWKENSKAALNYVFTVVNNDKPADGVQITVEKQSLGDRVKSVINDAMESLGVEAGNPTITPYCIEFIFNDKETDPNKKYHARKVDRIALTSEIERLIRNEPPKLDRVLEPFNMKIFRARLEKHLLIDLDLDWVFDVEVEDIEEPAGEDTDEQSDADETAPEVGRTETKAAPPPPPPSAPAEAPKRNRKPKEAPIPPEELGDPCETEGCGAPMRKTDTKCGKCGTEYEVDEPAPAPPARADAAEVPKTCKHCKAPVATSDAKCGACGKKVIPF